MTKVRYSKTGETSRTFSPKLEQPRQGVLVAPRPLEPLQPGKSGEIAPFQNKLDLIVRKIGITELHARTGVAQTTITNWRRGRSPRLDQVQKLARGLGMSASYFADDDIPPRAYLEGTESDGSSRISEADDAMAAEGAPDYPAGM